MYSPVLFVLFVPQTNITYVNVVPKNKFVDILFVVLPILTSISLLLLLLRFLLLFGPKNIIQITYSVCRENDRERERERETGTTDILYWTLGKNSPDFYAPDLRWSAGSTSTMLVPVPSAYVLGFAHTPVLLTAPNTHKSYVKHTYATSTIKNAHTAHAPNPLNRACTRHECTFAYVARVRQNVNEPRNVVVVVVIVVAEQSVKHTLPKYPQMTATCGRISVWSFSRKPHRAPSAKVLVNVCECMSIHDICIYVSKLLYVGCIPT